MKKPSLIFLLALLFFLFTLLQVAKPQSRGENEKQDAFNRRGVEAQSIHYSHVFQALSVSASPRLSFFISK